MTDGADETAELFAGSLDEWGWAVLIGTPALSQVVIAE